MLVNIKGTLFSAAHTTASACSRISRNALSRLAEYHPDVQTLSAIHLEATSAGVLYACWLDLFVAESLAADIILGVDWLHKRIAVPQADIDSSHAPPLSGDCFYLLPILHDVFLMLLL
ncbi:hypothetical protein GGX14DRAFT_562657 [Mycena pura]|uniref:Uncharacterized protein n=1 Tax=Mycena pura TaxID=153505 RepID=A0AAD6YJI3_9AGAR|nr:hypothetical protein GGX14DRAFT_562657 [Mycena pura]